MHSLYYYYSKVDLEGLGAVAPLVPSQETQTMYSYILTLTYAVKHLECSVIFALSKIYSSPCRPKGCIQYAPTSYMHQ